MFRNYLLATVRILLKERLYTGINAIGLAIGLATCFLIYSWIRFETSYDSYFPDSSRIFRVTTHSDESNDQGIASTYPMVRARVLSQFPEVEESARLFDNGFLGSKTKVTYMDKVFVDNRFFYGDASILKIFPFKMILGDASLALSKPNAVVLTQATAEKLFGKEDPVGKVIVVGSGKEFEVTGVVENTPVNTHFHFDLLASLQAHPWIKQAEERLWSGVVFHTYVKLKEQSSPAGLEKKIRTLLDNFPNDPQQFGKKLNLRLQPVEDIHLKSNMRFELEPNGDISYVYWFGTIAILVLLVAIMNYTNLTTARHTQRFKEVGMRKVMGASRSQLVLQFMTESLAITLAAFFIAFGLVEIAHPLLRNLAGQAYFEFGLIQPATLSAAIGIAILIGMLTGIFPALALSAFKPVKLFKSNLGGSVGGISVRKVLVVSQFTISIVLTICTAITYKQVTYLKEAKLGYNLNHTLVLNIGYPEVHPQYETLKSKLLGHASVLGVTASSQLPTDIQTAENIDYSKTESLGVNCVSVDADFFKVMGIGVNEGEALMASIRASDTINHFALNESALKAMGWKEAQALNRQISIRHGNQHPGQVVGVVKDFHFQSLHHTVGPLVIEFAPEAYQYLLVKIQPQDVATTLEYIASQWKEIASGIPFQYMFLDLEYDKLYTTETRSSELFIVFSSIAIVISLLGLFGLSSFTAERRTKEIGVRKILGAHTASIILTVSKDFLVLLGISLLLALPMGYYFMTAWLEAFPFRVEIHPAVYLLASAANFLLALMTLSYHSIRISRTNPTEALRYE